MAPRSPPTPWEFAVMAQWIHCPQCDQHYQFPDAAPGKQPACPKCGRLLSASAAAPAAARQAIPPVPFPLREQEPGEALWALPVSRKGGRPVAEAADGEDAPRRREKPPPPILLPPAAPQRPPDAATLPEVISTPDNPTVYLHKACGASTSISQDIAARISGDPFSFIPATLCAGCRRYVGLNAVLWKDSGENVAAYRARLRRQMHPLRIALRFVVGPLTGALVAAAVGAAVNLRNWDLGALLGVLIGLPLGYFVTGIVFQIAWAMSHRKKKETLAKGEPGASAPG
jgi:hypothetical protein